MRISGLAKIVIVTTGAITDKLMTMTVVKCRQERITCQKLTPELVIFAEIRDTKNSSDATIPENLTIRAYKIAFLHLSIGFYSVKKE